jgi:molybdopterin converting factor small subunit
MQVTVKFHGIIGDMVKRKSMELDLPAGATIADAQQAVIAGDETVAAILKQTRPFIDGKQTDRSAPLHDGAEVIFMRPIAGG